MSTTCGRPQRVPGVGLMWMHVDRGRGGVKTGFSCGRHKWMTPKQI